MFDATVPTHAVMLLEPHGTELGRVVDSRMEIPAYSAVNVLESGIGVCRDFTHLAIAMCRALNIPTRQLFGYLPDIGVEDPGLPMDFCAWMEVFLDGRWFTFDPRNNEHRIGRVVVGRGRDAADVALATSFGRVEMAGMTVWAEPGSGASWCDGLRPERTGRGLVAPQS